MPQPPGDDPFLSDAPSRPARTPQKKSSLSVVKLLLILLGGGLTVFACCAGIFVYHVYQAAENVQDRPEVQAERQASGEAAFDEANRKIVGSSGGTAHGNSDEARRLAEKFSTDIQVMREAFFTKRKKQPVLSLTEGKFPTYCRLDDKACVFLVHVPDLRKFTDDAKESMAELAWMTAQSVLRTGTENPPARIAVGIRGALLYDAVLVGDFVADEESADDGIRQREKGMLSTKFLHTFFKPEDGATSDSEMASPSDSMPEEGEPGVKEENSPEAGKSTSDAADGEAAEKKEAP